MGPFDFLAHLAGFLAPAFFLALLLPLTARIVLRGRAAPGSGWRHAGLLMATGTAVLVAGLWWFGRDGKMATYAALVLGTASVQWLLLRGWK